MRKAERGVQNKWHTESRRDFFNSAIRTPHSALRILPVLDLLNGVVVRGTGGRRDEYRPVQSVLTDSSRPIDVARAFRQQLGLMTLYVADLDGILHQRPNFDVYQQLIDDGFELWIDRGLRSIDEAREVLSFGAAQAIVALETLSDASFLAELVKELGSNRIVFSLDLKAGQPLLRASDETGLSHRTIQRPTTFRSWKDATPLGIARAVIDAGVTQMIVLDLAGVGEQSGVTTLELCHSIRTIAPSVQLITGGGVRNANDFPSLESAGIDAVLLATALHTGTIGRAECRFDT